MILEKCLVDASTAGSGNLEIMINGGRVACKVRELGGRQYVASFVPSQPLTHVIEMRFNGDTVKNSPWRVEYIGTRSIQKTDSVAEKLQECPDGLCVL